MTDTIKQKSKQIIYAQVILCKMQILTFITNICIQNSENSSRKWTISYVLFIIQIVIDIHSHRFEIFTPVSETHENVNLVLGIKNIFEL